MSGATTLLAAPPLPSVGSVVTEVVYYLALTAAAGVGMTAAALAPAESVGGLVIRRVRVLVMPVAVFVAVSALVQFLAAVARYAHTGMGTVLSTDALVSFIEAPPVRGSALGKGTVALIQLFTYLLLLLALLALRRRADRLTACLVFGLAVLTAVVPTLPFGAVTVDSAAHAILTAMHIIGVLIWVGGLTILAVLGLIGRVHGSSLSAADDSRRIVEDWSRIWERFGMFALYAVGLLVVSGAWLAWVHVGSPSQLLTTTYGRFLAIKLVLVLGMLAAGGYNARVLLPRIRALRSAQDGLSALSITIRHFPKLVAVEVVLAVAVLGVVPFLAGSARTEAGSPAARGFDFTVFGTGAILVVLVVAVLWAGSRVPTVDIGRE
ncbi:CopD family protein [Mycolicibacterium sp. Y3]